MRLRRFLLTFLVPTPHRAVRFTASPASFLVIYVIVLVGSFVALLLLIGIRIAFRQRTLRRFVRGIRQRFQSAEDRGAQIIEETPVAKPRRHPRASAQELQQVRSLVRAAEKAEMQQKSEEAERLLIQALTIQPQAHDVRAQLAKLYLTSDRPSKAEAMYRELLSHRDDVSFHANLGLAYYRQEKYEDACIAYEEAYRRDAKNPERAEALGRACIAARHYDQAVPLLEKASAFKPRDIELLLLTADCHLHLKQREKAEEVYRRLHKLDPYNEEIKAKMAMISMLDDQP